MAGRVHLHVVADDRTGALETAGALAGALGRSIPVRAGHGPGRVVNIETDSVADAGSDVVVVDLGTRAGGSERAAEVAGAIERTTTLTTTTSTTATDAAVVLCGHKIDSTLRGHWAVELLARQRVSGAPVVVIPALPELGRRCVDGTVVLDGVDEERHGADPDRWRPAAHLRRAGADRVHHLGVGDPVAEVNVGARAVTVVDASSTQDLDRIAASLVAALAERSSGGVRWPIVAGTSAAIAAMGRAMLGRMPRAAPPPIARRSDHSEVILICGSLHPMARRQLGELERRGDPSVVAFATDVPAVPPRPPDRHRAAVELARRARAAACAAPNAALVLIGGDTAAAVLGEDQVTVHGMLGPGTAWGEGADGRCVVSRAGGFGDVDDLVDLVDRLRGTLQA